MMKSIPLACETFSQGLGDCLDDPPTEMEVLSYPDLPAGAMYNRYGS